MRNFRRSFAAICLAVVHEFMAGNTPVDQTDPFGFLAGNIFAGKQKFSGFGRSDEILDQAHGAAGDRRGDLCFRRADLGVFCGDPDIAGQGQFIPGTQGIAVDGGNGGFFKPDDFPGASCSSVEIIAVFFQAAGFGFLQIRAGGKGPALLR